MRRRPVKAWDIPGVEPPTPTRLGEAVWLGPYPDVLESAIDLPVGPEARYEQRESISLAFITALQLLPPRQLAVLVLRDVLGFSGAETADMLDVSVASANSALARARTRLESANIPADSPPPGSTIEQRVAARFVRAYESADVPALVALLTDDVFLSMPPMPLEYVGADAAREFFGLLLVSGRRYSLITTRANGQLAFGAYVYAPEGTRRATGIFTAALAGDRICAMTRFEASEFRWFGLPMTLDR